MTNNRRVRGPILTRVVAALLLPALLLGCSSTAKKPAMPQPVPSPAPAPASSDTPLPPPPVPSGPQLSGAIGVMIENQEEARPQAGLEKADIVYELEAEGGITRFLALYYQNKVDKLGPVRSARMGFYDISMGYGIPYAHSGGNNDVLAELKKPSKQLLDVEEISGYGPTVFWRSTDRKAPHNLYTSTDRVLARAKSVGFAVKPLANFPEGPAAGTGKPVQRIAFTWGPRTQDVVWQWNGKRYDRSQSGGPHMTESGTRIQTDNLVVLFTRFSWDQSSQWGEGQYNVSIVGSGSGYFYRDGNAYAIHWAKKSRQEPYLFTLADGTPLSFAAGQTWVEVLKSAENMTEGALQ
ncbi:MAG: DUF3048 domain-containing protein [Mycobacterium leprae]